MLKRNRRLISVFLCFVFCFNLFLPVGLVQAEPLPQGEALSDIQGHWAEREINKWLRQSLVGGYTDGSFKPDQNLTRAEFVAMVNRAFGYTQKTAFEFTDVLPEDWYAADIAQALATGYINGYPDGTFRPNQAITRQEAAAIISQILSLQGAATAETIQQFKDQAEIPFWSLGSIGAIVANGYMGGYADETFRPEQPLTRAEAISTLDRTVGLLYKQGGTYGPLHTTTTVEGNVTLTSADIILQNMIITGDLYLSAGIEAGQLSLANVQVLGTVKIKGGTELYLSPETQLNTVVIDTPVAVRGEGVIQKAYINSSDVTLATKPEKIEIAEEVTDFNIEEDEPEPSEVEEEANINFASGYPQVGNIQTDRLDLIVKTNKDGKAYYLILPVSKDAPSPEQIITGRDASDKSVDSRHYGRIRLTADERTREQIRGLRPTTSYQLYLILEDEKGNLTEVTTSKATTKRRTASKQVTIESINDLTVIVEVGAEYTLPIAVTALMSDGTTQEVPVTWEPATVDTGEEGDYTFTGTVAGYAGEVTLTLRVVEEEVEKYQVTLEANPEEGGTVNGDGEYPVDATVIIEAEPNPGFIFLNWTENETEITTEGVYSFSMRAEDVSLTANFQEVETIQVTGVSLNTAEITLTEGETETLEATVEPGNATNQAVTWSSSDGAVATVDEEGLVTAIAVGTATITVTTVDGGKTDTCEVIVVESEPDTYTVTFKDHDGTTLKTETVNHGSNATAPADPTREGYTFTGWDTVFTNVTGDLTVTAQYTINTYTVTFNNNGGDTEADPQTKTAEHGGNVGTLPAAPTKVGHNFVGWNTQADGNGDEFTAATAVTADLTVYAQWAINQYTLTYTAGENGSITGDSPQTVNHGASGTAVTAEPAEGYQFVDWSDGSTANPRTDTNVTADISVTANFAINTYTVTFKDHDGTTLKTETVNHGSNATAPADPTREGYTFTGWDTVFTNVTGDLTVTAQYTINTYTVTFNNNGGDTEADPQTKTAEHGGNVGTLPAAPTKVGHNFVGWNTQADGNGDEFTAATAVTADLTVYAQWAGDTEEIKVTGINIVPETLTLAVGAEGLLTVTLTPDNANNTKITWTNSAPEVATVNSNIVTAKAVGTTTITVTTDDGGYTDTCTVTVVEPVKTITVSGAEGAITVEKGKTLQMSASIEPSDATDSTITWSVEDGTGSAIINAAGLLTGTSAGTVTVIATAKDGFGAVGTLEITVVEPVGVSWTVGPDTKMTRLGAAQDFKAEKFEDIGDFFNQFYPWSEMKLCNVNDDGDVIAWIGEEGFTRTDPNKQVMVQIPKFYYKHTYDGSEHQFWVADQPIAGFALHPCFIRAGVEKEYVMMGAYKAGAITDVDDGGKIKLTSVSGSIPAVSRTRATFRTQAQNRGDSWYIVDALARNAVSLLYLVEYADTNCQTAIGQGIVNLRYNENDKAVKESTEPNTIIVSSAIGDYFKVGQVVGIGTSLGGGQVCQHRTITKIEPEEGETGNVIITVDGNSLITVAGNIIYHVGQKTGGCDSLDGESGRAPLGTDGEAGVNGQVSVSYRGIEDLWGNVWEFIDGINIKNGNGLIREPYIADSNFADNKFDDNYTATGITLPETNGYCGNFAASEDADWLLMPNTLGGSTSTYIPDYFYQNWANTADKVALAGGRWNYGNSAGLFYWLLTTPLVIRASASAPGPFKFLKRGGTGVPNPRPIAPREKATVREEGRSEGQTQGGLGELSPNHTKIFQYGGMKCVGGLGWRQLE
jgi:uncharacterized repeat protein (TIGR02543 family)